MSMGQAIASAFRNYFRFQGRATRSEFWWWTLFTTLVNIALVVVPVLLKPTGDTQPSPVVAVIILVFAVAQLICSLAFIMPGISVSVRRLHDTDRSGWWYLIAFTGIGGILLLIWFCSRGTPGANRFGLESGADIANVFGDGAPAATLRDQRI